MSGFQLDDYIDVAERIRLFIEKYPEGSLQGEGRFVTEDMENGRLVGYLYTARAYRSPEDPRPGVGTAFEPIPGKTTFTRDSEVMNCETSAWGRAIIAAGIPSKKIASADEIQGRSPYERPPAAAENGDPKKITDAQMRKLGAVIKELKDKGEAVPPDFQTWEEYARHYAGVRSRKELTSKGASDLIDHLEAMTLPFG